jgi:hypothetical protein
MTEQLKLLTKDDSGSQHGLIDYHFTCHAFYLVVRQRRHLPNLAPNMN